MDNLKKSYNLELDFIYICLLPFEAHQKMKNQPFFSYSSKMKICLDLKTDPEELKSEIMVSFKNHFCKIQVPKYVTLIMLLKSTNGPFTSSSSHLCMFAFC